MSIFERASRCNLRFKSNKGLLSVEQLWDLPLTAQRTEVVTLDALARAVNRELKACDEESFVLPAANPRKTELQLQLDILKRIIEVRLAEKQAAEEAEARREERRRILDALANKQQQAIDGMSEEDLRKRLQELQATS